jgi:uncharacterized membrane protein
MGRAVFALVLVGIGILGFVEDNFAPIWQPVPKGVPARELVAYLCAFVCLACGLGLLVERAATLASRVLVDYFLVWLLLFRVPDVVRAPLTQDPWSGIGETAVYVAAAWVLYARFASDWDVRYFDWASGERGLRIARVIYGLSMIPFGIAHFSYINETASFVPAWIPFHLFWAYLTGIAYLAAGAAIVTGFWARWAAILSAWQMGLFTVLIWVPIVVAGPSAFAWSEFVISVTLTAAGWVVAESYARSPTSEARIAAGTGSNSAL